MILCILVIHILMKKEYIMENNTTVTVTAKILKEDEQVINVWLEQKTYHIVIRRHNGEVFISRITLDENGNPRREEDNPLIITFGEGEVESQIKQEGQEPVKIITC